MQVTIRVSTNSVESFDNQVAVAYVSTIQRIVHEGHITHADGILVESPFDCRLEDSTRLDTTVACARSLFQACHIVAVVQLG